MPELWDGEKDEGIWRDIGRVKRRLNELRVPNTQEDIQQWINECLWYAAMDDQFAVCEYLLRNGGDPTRKIFGRYTAIHRAAIWNCSRLLQLFMDDGWSPDVTDIFGLTSLWWAGYSGHKDCVEILLSRGADPLYEKTQSDINYLLGLKNGVSCDDSPLAAATKCHHGDIVAMMQDIIKARLSVASAGGETAETMTDVCQGCQQLTSEVCLLTDTLAQKDEQIYLLERTVNDMREELTLRDGQILSLSEGWVDLKKSFSHMDQQVNHVITSSDCLLSSFAQCPEPQASASCMPSQSSTRRVLRAVQRFSSSRWYALGRECGQTLDELYKLTLLTNDTDRVQALFDQMAVQRGETKAAEMLLSACGEIAEPTLAAVKEELERNVK